MKHFIIYHDKDLDGECSAAVVYNHILQQPPHVESDGIPHINLIGADYGRDYITPNVMRDDHVYIVDFSLPLQEMNSLNNYCHLTWIDHHTKRLQEAEEAGFQANAGQSLAHDKPAASRLTWHYFYPGHSVPPAVALIADYDAWVERKDWNSKVVPFQLGMTVEDSAPDSPRWPHRLYGNPRAAETEVGDIIHIGTQLYHYRTAERQFLKKQATPCLWPTESEVYSCLCLNSLDVRADFWDEMLTDEERADYDLLINYGYDGQPAWRITLSPADRTHGPDCSVIAANHGGGGHEGRAGFCCSFPPFLPTHQEVNPT